MYQGLFYTSVVGWVDVHTDGSQRSDFGAVPRET